MIQLFLLVVTISLTAYVTMAGMSYFDASAMGQREAYSRWSTTMLGVTQAWTAIRVEMSGPPSSAKALADKAIEFVAMPDRFVLKEVNASSHGWCIEGLASEADFLALKRLAIQFPRSYGLSTTCRYSGGVDPLFAPDDDSRQYPTLISITYRISGA